MLVPFETPCNKFPPECYSSVPVACIVAAKMGNMLDDYQVDGTIADAIEAERDL